MSKYRSITFILFIAILATLPFVYSCGDKAIGADGTVIAEFEWDGKTQDHTRRNDARNQRTTNVQTTTIQRQSRSGRIHDPYGGKPNDTMSC